MDTVALIFALLVLGALVVLMVALVLFVLWMLIQAARGTL